MTVIFYSVLEAVYWKEVKSRMKPRSVKYNYVGGLFNGVLETYMGAVYFKGNSIKWNIHTWNHHLLNMD